MDNNNTLDDIKRVHTATGMIRAIHGIGIREDLIKTLTAQRKTIEKAMQKIIEGEPGDKLAEKGAYLREIIQINRAIGIIEGVCAACDTGERTVLQMATGMIMNVVEKRTDGILGIKIIDEPQENKE